MVNFESRFFKMSLKNKKNNLISRWFKPRDLMIREQDKISFCSLTARQQGGLFLIFVALTAWSVFASFYFLCHDSILSRKTDDLEKIRVEHGNLKGEMLAFADHLDKIVARMDEHQRTSDQFKQNQSGRSIEEPKIRKISASDASVSVTADQNAAEKLEADAVRLKEEVGLMRERLSDMIESNENASIDDKRLSYHKVLLQRDMAAAEARALQEKVRSLEKLISGMQEAQILAFRKMATLADGGISSIEDGLSDIKQSLSRTGVGMETLLSRIRRDKETVGIGGPFIPAPMPKPQHDLNISLVSLNQRLDRWYDLTTLQNSLPLGKPVERIRVTSPFGARGDPFQGAPAHHEAVDLGGMIGEPVYATAPGKVVRTGSWGWYGNMIEIDHGLGFRTRYAHMEKIFVTKGETVRAGDRIGTLGNTGRSTGPHLHYEIRIRGIAVDPMKFIKAKKNVFKG